MIGYMKKMEIQDSNAREMFYNAIDGIVDMMYLCREDLEAVNNYMIMFTGYEMAMNSLGYYMTVFFKKGIICFGVESLTLSSFDGKLLAEYEYMA